MNGASNSIGSRPGKGRVVEIVGPAGAGKSTLYQALGHYPESIRLENFPDVRKAADAPFFILNGLRLIPSLLRLYRLDSRQLTRREFAWMTILMGWSALLRRGSNNGNKVLILDQGPVYLLAEMRLFGPEYLRQKAAERIWRDLYGRWKTTLHMVVYLDASDQILLDRIRNRRQEHIVKTQPATIGYEFLDRYRAEYELILSTLTAHETNITVLRFDTGQQPLQDIMNQFLSEIS
jgi:adenylate kinase family enzyme